MRTPWWETSPGALRDFFETADQVHRVDLLTIVLSGGTTIRWHSGDQDRITIDGNTWTLGPIIERGRTRLVVGVEVSTMPLTLTAGDAVTIAGQPLPAYAVRGGFDNARITLDKVFSAGPGKAWIGALRLFQGRASEPTATRHGCTLVVKSDMELLNTMVPRNVYQPGCLNSLYDGACGVSRAAFTTAATASGGTDFSRTIFPTSTTLVADRMALGWATCLTGANAGISRTVRTNGTNSVTTIAPWPFDVAPGDTFSLLAGCDKTQATCASKFSNLARFRGMPYVPAPETVA